MTSRTPIAPTRLSLAAMAMIAATGALRRGGQTRLIPPLSMPVRLRNERLATYLSEQGRLTARCSKIWSRYTGRTW